jgi:pimeloyl-ACP methyl ester carboxylesterase
LSLTLVGPAGLLLRETDVSTWEALVRSGGPGGLWASLARQSILNLVDGEVAPEPPAGWRERVAKDGTLYDMEAVQVWQRENHAGHVAVLVGMCFDVGVFDEHEAYRMVAQGPVGKKSLVILGEHDELFLVERMRRELHNCGRIGGFEVMKDVGHLVVRQKPRETAEALVSFWDGWDEE